MFGSLVGATRAAEYSEAPEAIGEVTVEKTLSTFWTSVKGAFET